MTATPTATDSTSTTQAVALTMTVSRRIDHDTTSFTQGLVLVEGRMYESAGGYGASSLRRVDPATGDVLAKVGVGAQYFAEGLAAVGDRLIQLTWREGTALVYDQATLRQLDSFTYEGEGWGLCFDGAALVMSNGSSTLTFRHPVTFQVLRSVDVRRDGMPVAQLNELECLDGRIWANVWMTDAILRIDPTSGIVDGVLDASSLLTAAERVTLGPDDVLNGIAGDGEGRLYLTGKRWPAMFVVRVGE